jgi:hypothetical protein
MCGYVTGPASCGYVTGPRSIKLLANFYTWKVSVLVLNTTHIRMAWRLIFWHKNWERIWKQNPVPCKSASDRQ